MATALGYKRCWCQKSTDHRGTVLFPGIVCTLLSDAEVRGIFDLDDNSCRSEIMFVTEGVVYEIPRDLVRDLLKELDFREKVSRLRNEDNTFLILLPERHSSFL